MTYRSKESVALPLYVQTQIHFNKDGGSVSVMVGLKVGYLQVGGLLSFLIRLLKGRRHR